MVAALAGSSRKVRGHAIRAFESTGRRDIAPLLEHDPELLLALLYSSIELAEYPAASEITEADDREMCESLGRIHDRARDLAS